VVAPPVWAFSAEFGGSIRPMTISTTTSAWSSPATSDLGAEVRKGDLVRPASIATTIKKCTCSTAIAEAELARRRREKSPRPSRRHHSRAEVGAARNREGHPQAPVQGLRSTSPTLSICREGRPYAIAVRSSPRRRRSRACRLHAGKLTWPSRPRLTCTAACS